MLPDQRVGFLEPPGGLVEKYLLMLFSWILHTEIHEDFENTPGTMYN